MPPTVPGSDRPWPFSRVNGHDAIEWLERHADGTTNDDQLLVAEKYFRHAEYAAEADRFDTPDDEEEGKYSVNFLTNPQGEIDRAEMSLDEAAISFTRRVPAELALASTLGQYRGTYMTPSGGHFDVVLRPDGTLALQYANGTFQNLIPWEPRRFRIKEFADVTYEFVVTDGKVMALKSTDPTGETVFRRQ